MIKQPASNKRSSFRICSQKLFLTYPQNDGTKEDLMLFLTSSSLFPEYQYILICKETHSLTEDISFSIGSEFLSKPIPIKKPGVHLHALVLLTKKFDSRDASSLDFNGKHGDYQSVRSVSASEKYLKKGTDWIESGSYIDPLKVRKQQSNDNRKELNHLIVNTPSLTTLIDDGNIPMGSLINTYRNKQFYSQLKADNGSQNIQRQCFWIYGSSGIGKSYYVKNKEPSLYNKISSVKWWDLYNGEDAILLDDFDKSCRSMYHDIKIWADNYRFNCEVKGGQIYPTYTKFYITSGYLPHEIWDGLEGDSHLIASIFRRFKFVTIDSSYELIDFDYLPPTSSSIVNINRERSRDNSPDFNTRVSLQNTINLLLSQNKQLLDRIERLEQTHNYLS